MKKILIIEDDQLVANIYRNKFSADGFHVEIAFDGQAGFDLVKTFHPDAVVLDLMLPKITGVELLKKIRAEAGLQQLPIIVFSNTYLSNMVQEAWKAGATKCLSKANCTPKQVIEALRGLLTLPSAAGAVPGEDPSAAPADMPAGGLAEADADGLFQDQLRLSFIDTLPGTITALRATLRTLTKAANEAARIQQLQELY